MFDPNYMKNLEVGKEIEYEWKQSGDFRNITGIGANSPKARRQTQKNSSPSNDMLPNNRTLNNFKDLRMVKMSTPRSAGEIYASAHLDPTKKKDITLKTAREFERYILEDLSE